MNHHPKAAAKVTKVPGNADDAWTHAAKIAMDTNRDVVPVRVFQQGDREMLSGALPIRVLTRILDYNAATKGATAAKALTARNRPVAPDHVRTIKEYLLRAINSGENYIIPPLTLNSTQDVEIVLPNSDASVNTGYAVFPDEAAVHITDGQHRYLAIRDVVDGLRGTDAGEKFMRVSVPVMMTIESDLSQVHQDFADAGRTKPLPSSLLAVYDSRQPANAALLEICERVQLLDGRIDATSATLGQGSQFVFLVNQVRQFVKSSLTGNATSSEVGFARQAEAALSNPDARKRWVTSRVAFLNVMTEIIDDWKELSELPKPGGPDAAEVLAKTKSIRAQQRVPITAAFLNALGVVSHEVLSDSTSEEVDQSQLENELRVRLNPLKSVDWNRSADFWAGNLVLDGRIRTQTPAIKAAAANLSAVLEQGQASPSVD